MAGRWLDADDPLPFRPARVLVAGTSGAGKTTLADKIAATIIAPHTEIDALFHGPAWQPRETFLAEVDQFSSQPTWVTEWQYATARTMLAGRADTLVWLDLPRPVVMGRVVWRTLRRRFGRELLWNGNREPPLRTVLTDRDHIIRWAWRTHRSTTHKVLRAASEHPHLMIVRLRTHGEAKRWLAGPLRASIQ